MNNLTNRVTVHKDRAITMKHIDPYVFQYTPIFKIKCLLVLLHESNGLLQQFVKRAWLSQDRV